MPVVPTPDPAARLTARLRLRPMREDDLPWMRRLDADPVVMATLGGVRTTAETEAYLRRQLAHQARHGFGWWTVLDAATGAFAGRGGLRRVEVEGAAEVEVGYALVPALWGRGLATELARTAVAFGLGALGLSTLVAFTLPTNGASRRVMEKAGLGYEREIVYGGFPQVLYRIRQRAPRP